MKVKDTGIVFGDFFIPYSQEFGLHQYQKKSVNAFKIEGLIDIDNYVALFENNGTKKIVSLISSSNSLPLSDYSTVQMKHGIIVGFNSSEGKYEQLQ
jgi:hypothetical protein